MRILMLNNEFPPIGGGTGTVNKALLERIALDTGVEIDLITATMGKHPEIHQFARRVRIHKVPVGRRDVHHASNAELIVYTLRSLHFALKLHRKIGYDFAFGWSAVPAGAVALALQRLTGLPYIVRVCGPDIPGFERRYSSLYSVLTPVIRAVWHGADVVIAKCTQEARMIRAVDPRPQISLVPNGVDLNAFLPGEPIPENGPLRLLCVGRLIERKGQHHLIEAVKRLVDAGQDVVLDLAGTGDALSDYQALVHRLELHRQVRFLGYVPREQIPTCYAAAHVFVLPSYNEGMSVAALEAMAAGLPVVLTPTGGTDELVEEGVNGLIFEWGDIDQLTGHLRHLAEDRSLVRAMGSASRRRAAQFTWERAASEYRKLFARIAGRKSGSEPESISFNKS